MSLNIHPKVQAAAIAGLTVSLALGDLTSNQPQITHALGASGPMVFGLVVAALSSLAGYLKVDTTQPAPATVVTANVAPVVVAPPAPTVAPSVPTATAATDVIQPATNV